MKKIPVVLKLFLGMGSDLTMYTFDEFRKAAARLDIKGIETFIEENFDDCDIFFDAESRDEMKEYIESCLTDDVIRSFVRNFEGDEITYHIAEMIIHEGSKYINFDDVRKMIKNLDI